MKEEYLRVLYELSQKDGQPTFSYSEQQVACGHNDAARLSTYLGLKIVLVRDGVGQWMIGETDYTVRAGDILKEEAIHAELLSLLVGISRAYRRKYRKTESVNDILSQRQSFERVSRAFSTMTVPSGLRRSLHVRIRKRFPL